MSYRWTRILGSTAVCTALAAAVLSIAATPKPAAKPAAMSKAAKIERGAYLTTVMGCNDCHTPGTLYGAPDFGRRLAGSDIPWKGPWGVSYARNLTPDLETGLGYWKDTEIVTALRTGVKPDGKVLQPPMPWPNLSILTDEDAYAIAAYLQDLPPIVHQVHDALPPGAAIQGPVVEFPPPTAWEVPPKDATKK